MGRLPRQLSADSIGHHVCAKHHESVMDIAYIIGGEDFHLSLFDYVSGVDFVFQKNVVTPVSVSPLITATS